MNLQLLEYYVTGKYKGFLLSDTHAVNGQTDLSRFVFSNGSKQVTVLARFQEEALLKAFKKIDYHFEKTSQPSYGILAKSANG